MEEKVLLLGATGNVGKPLINLFRKNRKNFTLGVFTDEQYIDDDVENQVPVNFARVDSLIAALKGIDIVFIIVPDSDKMVGHMQNICSGLEANAVKRFVYVGGLGVKVAPDTWLSDNLLRCEETLLKSGLEGAILRPGFFMQNFINHYPPRKNNTFSMPMGKGKINYINSKDVAAAAYECLTNKRFWLHNIQFYSLTGNEALDPFEIAATFSQVLGKKYSYSNISLEKERKAMQQTAPDWRVKMLMGIYTHVQNNSYAISHNDFKKITGKSPTTFSSFIEENRFFFENN